MLKHYQDKYAIKIGFVPTRRGITRPNAFNRDTAIATKTAIEGKLLEWHIDYVNLDFLNEEGLIYQQSDAEAVAKKLISEGVDAIFAPHCNFGTEDAIAKVGKLVGKPLLLWAPRDEAPDVCGNRLRDSQCGLFATSKVLSQFGVPFTYIANCTLDDPLFQDGFQNFLAAASVVKAFHGMRIGQIGTRPVSFLTVKANELELLQRFGIEVVSYSLMDVKRKSELIKAQQQTELEQEVQQIKDKVDEIRISDSALREIAAVKLAIHQIAVQDQLASVSILCTTAFRETFGVSACFIMSELTDDGLPAICETDIHGSITAVMAQAAMRGAVPTFLADLTIRHPTDPNAELLWHCGVFPHSLKKPDTISAITDHYNNPSPGVAQWQLKEGSLSILRFDGLTGDYKLFMTRAEGIDGPPTNGTYLWAKFKNWPKVERKLIYGPYIHHCVGVFGDVIPIIYEAKRYIKGFELDMIDPTLAEYEDQLI